MWEEPRPERLRKDNSDRSRDVLHSLLAYAIIIFVVVILLNAGVIDWRGWTGREQATPAMEQRPSAPAAVPGSVPAQGSGRATVPPDRNTDRPAAPARAPTSAARGDTHVMQRLTETCRYWTQQNTRGHYSGNQEMACREMIAYAREHGFPVPAVGGSGPRLPAGASDSTVRSRLTVHVDQCDRHGYGSIDYRRCRANEKRRLTEWCGSLRAQRDGARGTRRDTLNLHVTAVCSEADRYQIVR
jgi:hypothetical protein